MKYFTFKDFTRSDVSKQKNIDNEPDMEVTDNIIRLAETLDDLREAWATKCEDEGWGKPGFNISSGYRCKELNRAVGGSKTSAHLTGNAADIVPTNGKVKELIEFTRNWFKENNRKYDQIIDEYGGAWMHIGLFNNEGKQRMMDFSIQD